MIEFTAFAKPIPDAAPDDPQTMAQELEITDDGWLRPATQRPSPNCDNRPDGTAPELVVIHSISLPPGEFGGPWIEDLFQNRLAPDRHPYFRKIFELRVSAHLLIRRDGEIIQFVSFDERAWHAGASNFRGRDCCNDFSIGIELEGCDEVPFTDAQYARLAETTSLLLTTYPDLDPDRIAGHADIAPGRKTDPGPRFDWPRYKATLRHE